MKPRWTKLKNASQNLFSALKRHQTTIYYALVVLLMSLSFVIVQDIKHTKEILKLQNKQAVLLSDLREVNGYVFDQLDFIQEQAKLIDKYENILQSAKDSLEGQSGLINDLINYLKKIDHWPPKESRPAPKIDRSKWTASMEGI